MDIFSSSVTSIEGHSYALIITDDCTGQLALWFEDKDVVKAVKKWYIDIAELRETHTVLAVMHAG